MKNSKISDINLKAGIHTVSIRSRTESPIRRGDVPWLKSVYQHRPQGKDYVWYIYQLNLNHMASGDVWNLADFEILIQQAADELGLASWDYVRVDIRLDQFVPNYESLRKLNRLLITGVSIRCDLKNRYESDDFLTGQKLTIRAQNDRLQVENYNKSVEQPDSETKNRLELRTVRVYESGTKKDLYQLVEDWKGRLQHVLDDFDKVQDECNRYLLERWQIEKEQGDFRRVSDFLWKHQSQIYCRPQLIKLLTAIGVKNPSRAATNYKSRSKGLEYFCRADLKGYIDKIIQSLTAFQTGEPKVITNDTF